jgi:hypothetical protein
MYSIQKDWKLYNVYLPTLHIWLTENAGSGYRGMSADLNLRIHFEEQPGYEIEGAIDMEWDSLTEEGEAAKCDRIAAEAEARDAILNIDWGDMIVAERKIVLNRPITEDDRIALLVKYPQS